MCLVAGSLIENGSTIRGEGCFKAGEEIKIDEEEEVKKEDDLLHFSENSYRRTFGDIIVPEPMVHNHHLRDGDIVSGPLTTPVDGRTDRLELQSVEKINGMDATKIEHRDVFDDLVPIKPDEQFHLEQETKGIDENRTGRVIDFFAPIGKGQRGLIVAPPQCGKTTVLLNITHAIEANHPDVELIVLLIDERPEEVTDMMRSVKSEVVASTFRGDAREHIWVAEMVIEQAKRKVEMGKDIVIMLDSITRLGRAMQAAHPQTYRVTKGGVVPEALERAKRLFGAGCNIEGGGSLTIIATALIETGVSLDETIYEEFNGRGNMKIRLNRSIADIRLFPAVSLKESGTRADDLLLDHDTWHASNYVRGELKENTFRNRENHIKNTKLVYQKLFNKHDSNKKLVKYLRQHRGESLWK